jgi:hypothetical protein
MIINNLLLALMCHDSKHAARYAIEDGGKCYYNGKYIGEIKEELDEENSVLNVYFRPVTPIEYININITISPAGTKVKT